MTVTSPRPRPEDLPTPPFEPELAEPLRAVLAELPMPLTPHLIADRRRRSAAGRLPDEALRRGGAFTLEALAVPGTAAGPPIPLLLCRPTDVDDPEGVIYHTHGGGMVAGSHRSAELAGELNRAQELGLAVVSVDYRLAPEHPDPAPVEDCYAGLVWLADHADRLGLPGDRIVLSGNSAGGALAAGLALLARDRGGPRPAGQMLQFPMLDDRCDSFSSRQMRRVGLWDGQSDLAGWTALLGERRGTNRVSCYAAPARAADLSRLAPAFVEVGSVEALRDEAVEYAGRLWRAGSEAELHVWSGAFHSFDEWVPAAVVSATAHRARTDWLRRLLTRR